MFPSSSSSSTSSSELFHGFLGNVRSRKLLLHTILHQSPHAAAAPDTANFHDPSNPYTGDSSFDANVVMVLSVLLCALICALGVNSIIRCALRCSSRMAMESGTNVSARLANTGIKRKAMKTFPTVTYSTGSKLPGLDSECVICLTEFAPGERLRVLPKCNHGFHIRCIDKWLMSHSSCPTCRHCLLETCQKIVGCSQTSSSEPPPRPPQQVSVAPLGGSQNSSSDPPPPRPPQGSIAPLEPEGLIRNYRDSS